MGRSYKQIYSKGHNVVWLGRLRIEIIIDIMSRILCRSKQSYFFHKSQETINFYMGHVKKQVDI